MRLSNIPSDPGACQCGVLGSNDGEAANLILAGAWTGPDEGVRAEVALDISSDDFASDAFTRDEPLVHARRHGE